MKQKISVLLFMLAFAFGATAQTIGDYIDVLYLKNGSKIKGVIIEQVPGKTVKIKTKDGSEFVYQIKEVERFTREESLFISKRQKRSEKPDSLKYMNNYKVKQKGYFFTGEVLLNSVGVGARITNGYRFGRFGNLGIAIGVESINTSYYTQNYNPQVAAASLNLVYTGEILKKRITPFYQVEAGYGFSLDRYGYNREKMNGSSHYFIYEIDELSYTVQEKRLDYGGPMGALAFGVKFHTTKKIFFKVSLAAKITSNFSDTHVGSFTDFDGYYSPAFTYKDFNAKPGIGIRFGIGF